MSKRKHSPDRLNLLLLICTLISAVLTGLGMSYLHDIAFFVKRDNPLFMPLFMAILFAVFLLITCLIVFLISNLNGTYRADVITGRNNKGRLFLYLLAGILLIALLMMGAEFLYERDIQFQSKEEGADTYVFLIDDSSSMEISDPNNMRYSVIESMLSDKPAKTKFTVYTFSSEAKLCIPMRTVGDGFPTYPPADNLSTYMMAGLEKVIDDCDQGVWTPSGRTTMILITDGSPNDFLSLGEIQPILDRYVNRGINIGIVGVIGANNELMNNIATYTGGTFTEINDAGQMHDAVNSVSGNVGRERDLLSERNEVQTGWLYALIRILAFALAGSIIAVVSALCYGNNTTFAFMLWTNIIKAVLAAILMEVAFLLPFSEIIRLIAWILLGTIISQLGSTDAPTFDETMEMDFFDGPRRNASGYR